MSGPSRAFLVAAATCAGLAVNIASRLWNFPARESLVLHNGAMILAILFAVCGSAVSAWSRRWVAATLLAAVIPVQVLQIALAYRGHSDDFNHYNVDLAIVYAANIVLIWIPATAVAIVGAVAQRRKRF